MAGRLRSLLTLGLTDSVAALNERLLAIDAGLAALRAEASANPAGDRLDQLQKDIGALRSLVIATDEHAQRKLKAGLASAVNLISVLPQLQIEGVLPPFPHRGFEVTGELAVFLFHLVRRHRPKVIVELGCGSSSVLFASAVRANGFGRIISIENDREHLQRTAQYLRQTELSDWVELVEAPLVEQFSASASLQWYDLAAFRGRLSEKVDLLFIDGPPESCSRSAAIPALPALHSHLSRRRWCSWTTAGGTTRRKWSSSGESWSCRSRRRRWGSFRGRHTCSGWVRPKTGSRRFGRRGVTSDSQDVQTMRGTPSSLS
jgi:hypothetical protein